MKHCILSLACIIGLTLSSNSCSKQEIASDIETNRNYILTVSEAADNAVSLRNSMFPSSTKGNLSNISVSNVQVFGEPQTKNSDNDTLLYVVNFADDAGFAVLSADKRYSVPFIITENGSYDINQTPADKQDSIARFFVNLSYKYVLENVKVYKLAETHDAQNIKDAGFEIVSMIEHKMRTAWNQNGVYFENTGKVYAGCVATALAQIFAYYHEEVLDPLYIKDNYIDFENLLSESRKNDGKLNTKSNSESRKDVTALQLWIGQSSDAEYNSDGTPISSKKALQFAKSVGFETAPKQYAYDVKRVLNGLQEDKLTYITGADEAKYFIFENWDWPVGGHAWVIDGYAKVEKNGTTSELVHVNWGWGGSKNGYYYDGLFDSRKFPVAESGDIIDYPIFKPVTKSDNDGNFCFFQEMSHVYPYSWK
jgi:hypothetical protein